MVAASPTAQDRLDVFNAQLILTPTVALVAELACEVLGPAWLDEINRRHRAAGRSEIEALDERAALALLASESQFRDMIGPEWQARARQLNAIFNAAIHNNQRGTWRHGDAQHALRLSSEIKTFLERRAAPVPPHAPQHHDRPYHPAPEPLRQVGTALDVLVSKPAEAGDAPVAGRRRARRLARRDRARATFGQSPSAWAWASLTLGLMGCFMFPFAPLAWFVGARVRAVLAAQEAVVVDAAALDTVDARPVVLTDGATFALKTGFHAGRIVTVLVGAATFLWLVGSMA
ncbi:MAG: hypothetical protein LC749_02860 [Actinobacteria bacterium]|nr:hypothetical protein [Actinomycetota bacterium]